jgi:hypothetical protein
LAIWDIDTMNPMIIGAVVDEGWITRMMSFDKANVLVCGTNYSDLVIFQVPQVIPKTIPKIKENKVFE